MAKIAFHFLCITLGCSELAYSQIFWYHKQTDATISAAQKESAEAMLQAAYDAYNAGNLEKTKYYLDQSERNGWVSAGFYYLLGMYSYDTKNFSAAKRYWMRGFNKRGCWECKELADKMELGKPVKPQSNPAQEIVIPKSETTH